MPKNLLLIDFNNVMFASMAVHGNFEHEGTFTGGVYGFLIQVAKLVQKFRPENVIVLNDSPPYERKIRFPEYKSSRKREEDPSFPKKMQDSRKHIHELCLNLDIPVWGIKGAEADDLIAHIARTCHTKFDRIIVKSNDEDLKQMLVYDNFYFWRNKGLYGVADFREEHPGVEPEEWLLIEALAGTHNAVPGINRVGVKTAIKILHDPKKLKEVDKLHADLIARNLQLIELPCPWIEIKEDIPFRELQFNERSIIRYLDTLGIDYTPFMQEAFGE